MSNKKPELSQDIGAAGTKPSLSSQGAHERRREQSPASADEVAARSRSRSAARSTDNLLVSLDSCPPIANESAAGEVLHVERSLSMRLDQRPSLLSRLGLSRASREDDTLSESSNPALRSNSMFKQRNPRIKHRYSTKQLVAIFKSLGRFQSPLEHHELYSIDLQKAGKILKKDLMIGKPAVVLEHLKTEKALPLTTNVRIQGKIYSRVTQQLNQIDPKVRVA